MHVAKTQEYDAAGYAIDGELRRLFACQQTYRITHTGAGHVSAGPWQGQSDCSMQLWQAQMLYKTYPKGR